MMPARTAVRWMERAQLKAPTRGTLLQGHKRDQQRQDRRAKENDGSV